MGRNQQLSLATDGGTLQVTWSIGDADVIGYMGKDTFKKAFFNNINKLHWLHRVIIADKYTIPSEKRKTLHMFYLLLHRQT